MLSDKSKLLGRCHPLYLLHPFGKVRNEFRRLRLSVQSFYEAVDVHKVVHRVRFDVKIYLLLIDRKIDGLFKNLSRNWIERLSRMCAKAMSIMASSEERLNS